MKDKGKLKHHLPSFFPTRLSFTVSFLIPLPLSTAVKVDVEWGHSSSVPFLPSHLFPLLQCGPSIGHSSFRTYSPDQTWSSPWAAVWIFAPPWSLHRLHWNLYSGTWSISHPYFCSHLGFLRTGFHFFFSSLHPAKQRFSLSQIHFPPEAPPPWLWGSAVPWPLLTETSLQLPLPTPGHLHTINVHI